MGIFWIALELGNGKMWLFTGAFDSAKNHKRQRRKRQSITAKRWKFANAKVRID